MFNFDLSCSVALYKLVAVHKCHATKTLLGFGLFESLTIPNMDTRNQNDDLYLSSDTLPVQDQITKYEHFVDVVLKNDLHQIMARHDKLCEQINDYKNVKSTIETVIANKLTQMKAMCDFGSNLYVKCVV